MVGQDSIHKVDVGQEGDEMADTPYSRFENKELIRRDELAVDRTRLANERTLLAYLRAGVALMIAGASIIHFARHGWFRVIGVVCIPSGVLTGIVGAVRFLRMNRAIAAVRRRIGVSGSDPRGVLPDNGPP